MNCSEVKKWIQLYMDSELEARDTLEVQRHLESCSSCNRALQVLTEQDEKLRVTAHAEVIGGAILRDRVLQSIRQEERRPMTLKSQVRRGALGGLSRFSALARVAAIVLVAGLVVFVLLKTGNLRDGLTAKVYAEAIEDHQDHCMLENTAHRMYTDTADIDPLTRTYCRMSAPMDLSSLGLSGARARPCGLDGKAYLHLLYFRSGVQNDGSMHQGISFFVLADDSAPARSLSFERKDGLVVGSVSRPGISIVVVSPFSEDETKKATILALSQLSGSQ